MGFWLTIEIQHGEIGADGWRRAHGESLIEAAVTNGARSWEWHTPRWGLILELEFGGEEARDAFRNLPAVTAALDAVPDPTPAAAAGRELGCHGALVPRRPRGRLKWTNLEISSSTWWSGDSPSSSPSSLRRWLTVAERSAASISVATGCCSADMPVCPGIGLLDPVQVTARPVQVHRSGVGREACRRTSGQAGTGRPARPRG